ncbi:MAG: hypothetical protein KKF62_03035 [Bacteroidetes bacterium]|nr:hypothetical protein [Bacteroidota bacterium]MBU1115025.1 hypothetical protein [Bacteroidota bacterium]MBU1799517.1 hypothetical protein [Bacteroidota bacterium]
MKYLEELIEECEEIKVRFEESKELILCCDAKNRLDEIVNNGMLLKYSKAISSVDVLRNFLVELKACNNDEEIIGLMIRAKN